MNKLDMTISVVTAGNCILCGKNINYDNIFLCKNCKEKQKSAGRKEKQLYDPSTSD